MAWGVGLWFNSFHMKSKSLRIVMTVLLFIFAGLTTVNAQTFTVGNLNYSVNEDGVSVTVTGHVDGTSATGALVIPESVELYGVTYPVTIIGSNAFELCHGLTGTLVIPNSVITIGSDAFYYCDGFTGSLVIPNSVVNINGFAFYHCSGLTGSLIIGNSVKYIANYAFAYTNLIGALIIPENVTNISNGAFKYCNGFTSLEYYATNCSISMSSNADTHWLYSDSNITTVTLGNNVKTIPTHFLDGCTSITGELVFPEYVTSIGEYAFNGCTGFTGQLNIPLYVTSIGANAFAGCTGLSGTLTIGHGVTEIGNTAFFGACENFTSYVILPDTPPTLGNNVFASADFGSPVYVHCGSVEEYQNSEGWNTFTNIQELNPCLWAITLDVEMAYGGTVSGDGMYQQGQPCMMAATPNAGYAFDYWEEDGVVVSTNQVYAFSVTSDRHIVAHFTYDNAVYIGDRGDQTNGALPIYSSYRYNLTQQIYTADEIGGAGNINRIAFFNTESQKVRNWDIYIVNTNKTEFASASDFIVATDSDKVFSGEITMISGDWTTITFDTPFAYDGVSNIAIIINDHNANYSYGMQCLVFDTELYQAIYDSNYESMYDPSNPATASYSWGKLNKKNQIIFGFSSPLSYVVTADVNPGVGGTVSANNGGKAIMTYNFANDMDGWTTIDADGDTYNWFRQTSAGHGSGSGYMASASFMNNVGALTPDNYLVSPQVLLGGSISFWAQAQDANYPAEHFGVAVSMAGNTDPSDFTTIQEWTLTAKIDRAQGAYYEFTADLSEFSGMGYVAIRHFDCTDIYYLNVDDITIIEGGHNVVANYVSGTTCTLTATASEGYSFANWTENGAVVSTNAQYSFTVTENRCLVANFANMMHDISVVITPAEGGTVTAAKDRTTATYGFEEGLMGWTTIDADGDGSDWYRLSINNIPGHNGSAALMTSASYNNAALTPDNYFVSPAKAAYSSITFYACAQDANWSAEHFGVAVSTTGNENAADFTTIQEWTMTAKGAGVSSIGRNGNTRDQGNWYEFNVDLSAYEGQNIYVAIRHFNCTDMFRLNVDDVTLTISENNTNVVGSYMEGQTCTLTATPNTGYVFNNWKENGSVVSTNATYSFTVTGDRTLVANFGLSTFAITATANPATGGTITGAGNYTYGSNATLTAAASTGYTFVNWTKNGVVVSSNPTYSFQVTEAGDYVANFVLNSYEITVSANPSEGGTVTGAGTYEHGASVALTATANDGYTFTNWKKNGTVVSTNATYTFTATATASYVATFTLNSYTIAATANPTEGGTVTGAGTYNQGATASLTATANDGYTFVNWTENGTQVSTEANYSFIVTENRTLVANFDLNTFEVNATTNPEDAGVITGVGTYNYGETATLAITPNENYVFVNWTENGVIVSEEPSFSFEVTENRTFVANLTIEEGLEDIYADAFVVYPNPADDIIFIETGMEISRCEIYTSSSRLVYKDSSVDNKMEINISDMPAGSYIIKFISGDKVYTRKFVKR